MYSGAKEVIGRSSHASSLLYNTAFSLHSFYPTFILIPIMPSHPKISRREHSSETIAVILKLHDLGYSLGQISREINVPKSTIHHIIHTRDPTSKDYMEPAKRPGRPPKLSRRAERALLCYVAKNPRDTLAALSTPSKSGHRLHPDTTRRYLAKNKVYAFKPRRKPYLSKKHKRDRLRWAKDHLKWGVEDWKKVIFSDESTFELGPDLSSLYVRRPLGKAYESRYLLPTFKSG